MTFIAVDEAKERVATGKKAKNGEKYVASLEADITKCSQGITGLSMRGMIFLAVINIGVFWILSRVMEGKVLLTLPFQPFSLVSGITHRGLSGENMYESGFLFIYILSSTIIRPVITKLMGTEQPKTPSPFAAAFQAASS